MPFKTITDDDIPDLISTDSGEHGGAAKLARKLGVSQSTAYAMRCGRDLRLSLEKPTSYYGYVAGEASGVYMKLNQKLDLRRTGYVRWSRASVLIEEVRRGLHARKTIPQTARHVGFDPARVGYAVRPRMRDPRTTTASK